MLLMQLNQGKKMAGTCNTYRLLAIHTKCYWENLFGRDHLEDLGIVGRIMEDMNLIHLAQVMD
jgi:hypothetical protein